MAPNRKTNVDVVDGLASLSVNDLVNPKFLPLTHPDEAKEEKQNEQEADITLKTFSTSSLSCEAVPAIVPVAERSSHSNPSYWDWPSDEAAKNKQLLQSICHQEEIRQTLSVTHVEETLQSAAVNADHNKVSTVQRSRLPSQQDHEEDYWYMPCEEDVSSAVAEESSSVNKSNDTYWNWSTPTVQEQKLQLINRIKQEEECRVLVSADHIQQRLVEASASMTASPVNETKPEHDSYWDWNETAPIASSSTMKATHVNDPLHPNNSYWDWPANTDDETETKDQLMKQIILEEGIRQGLSIEHIEASLVQASSSSAISPPVVTTTSATSPASYWDW